MDYFKTMIKHLTGDITNHFGNLDSKKLMLTLVLLIIICLFHVLSNMTESNVLRAVALRLYYLPVIYAAISSGTLWGFLTGIIAAIVHTSIMLHMIIQNENLLRIEHFMEMPFLMLAGFLSGLLRDNIIRERNKRREVSELFGSYISPEIVNDIIEKKIQLNGEEKAATILFSDIKGYTTFSEKMNPQQLFQLLNIYFSGMIDIVIKNHGFVDKFIGDALMAVYGVPVKHGNDPLQAINSAIEMQRHLLALNQQNFFPNHQLEMAIGINTGLIVAGNIGSRQKMEYTVLGDTVNLASRIETLNRVYGSNILITDSTYHAVKHHDHLLVREVDKVKVKGRKKSCTLYEIFNGCTSDQIRLKSKTMPDFEEGYYQYQQGHWENAKKIYQKVLAHNPEDVLTQFFSNRIDMLIKNPPELWDGIYEFNQK